MEKNNLGNFHFLKNLANEILQFFCILCFVVKITEVRQISDFRFFNSNAIPIFFLKKGQNDKLCQDKKNRAFNLNSPTILSFEWHRTDRGRNSVELCRACRVLQGSELVQYYILYSRDMVLIPI